MWSAGERSPERMASRRMSRRQVLGLGVAAAAGILAEGGASAGSALAAAGGPPPGQSLAALPRLASAATGPVGHVYRFRSRPDLAPAAVQIDIDKPGQVGGLLLMDSQGGQLGDQGPMIVDGSGQLVWFAKVSADPRSVNRAFNLRKQQWKGKAVLTWFDGSVVSDHGSGEDVIMDASYTEITRVQAGDGCTDDLHDFLLTPEGTALVTCYPLGYGDLSGQGGGSSAPYVYGVVQEIDVESGKVLFEWRSDQHVGFDESYAPMERGQAWDYFHVNSIAVANDGNLLISARNTWCVYKVRRSTGELLWRLGGKRNEFAFGPGARFAWQHDVTQHRDGSLSVFDNGAGDYRTERLSRGLVLDLDERARRVTVRRQLVHPRWPLQAGALGSVELLAGGHVFVGWGLDGAFTEFGAEGAPLLDGQLLGKGSQSYRTYRSTWTGAPAEPPAVVVEPHGTSMTVFASWNGATEVHQWAVLGGPGATLRAIGAAPRAGFETAITVPQRTARVAVAALDGSGRELGRSKAIAVT